MGMNFNTRQVDAVLPFHWASGPVGIGGTDVYDDVRHNILPPTTVQGPAPYLPGQRIRDPKSGQEFCYVKATVAVTVGQLLAPATSVAVANGVTNAGSGGTIVTAQAWTVGAYAGDFFMVNGGTGPGQAARILWNTATTLYLDRELAVALDATSDFVIYRPFSVALTAAATGDICVGVSTGTFTGDGYYGWMQVSGFCPMILAEAAIAAGASISASATAGKAIGGAGGAGDGLIGFAIAAASGADVFFGGMLQSIA